MHRGLGPVDLMCGVCSGRIMRAFISLLLNDCRVEEPLIQGLPVWTQIVLGILILRQLCEFGLVRLRPHFHGVGLACLVVMRLIFTANA